jgi:hypothetical protein
MADLAVVPSQDNVTVAQYLSLPDVVAWEKIPHESKEQHDAFLAYLEFPPRSITGLAEQIGSPTTTLYRWARRFSWEDRAREFDIEMDRAFAREMAHQARETARRHSQEARDTIKTLLAPVEAMRLRYEEDPERFIAELSEKDLNTLFSMVNKSAAKLPSMMNAERLAQGSPTEITKRHDDHSLSVDIGDPARIIDTISALGGLDYLSQLLRAGDAGEVIEAEAYEVHTDLSDASPDSLPPGSPT